MLPIIILEAIFYNLKVVELNCSTLWNIKWSTVVQELKCRSSVSCVLIFTWVIYSETFTGHSNSFTLRHFYCVLLSLQMLFLSRFTQFVTPLTTLKVLLNSCNFTYIRKILRIFFNLSYTAHGWIRIFSKV